MSRKQKIIVSITGIFLVLMILVGLTYAYFLTKITGNTNDKSISVTTANLEIKYEDNNDVIAGDRIEPGTTLPSKTFTVANNGNSTVDYSVGLVNIINDFKYVDDVVYTLTCTSYNKDGFTLNDDGTVTGTENDTCDGIDETTFPILNSYIVTNTIGVGKVHTYKITVAYKETGTDQSDDMNKTLKAKIDIFDPKSLTVKGNVINSSENDYIVIHSKEQESQILNGSYKFIGITPDEHKITIKNRKITTLKETNLSVSKGTPAVSGSSIIYNDEKNMADMDININDNIVTLDITKITNSPQTLREAILVSAKRGGENRTVIGTTVTEFISVNGENERVLNNAPDDYGTSYYFRGNVLDNYVIFLDMCWRIVRIQGDGSIKLILASELTCSDSNVTTTSGYATDGAAGVQGTILTANYGYKKENNYYINDYINSVEDNENSARTKLNEWFKKKILNNKNINEKKKLLIKEENWCIGNQKDAYSFEDTGKIVGNINDLIKNKISFEFATGNKFYVTNLISFRCDTTGTEGEIDKNKIGMLTYDEAVFAGGGKTDNVKYYLNNNAQSKYYWTLSPMYFDSSNGDNVDSVVIKENGQISHSKVYFTTVGIRPVISLKFDTTISSGNGTISNPYVIQ